MEVGMAQRVDIALEDDIEGGPAHETLRFGIDRSSYEIDLNRKNATRFRRDIAPYIEHGRRAGGGQRRHPSASARLRSIGLRASPTNRGVTFSESVRLGPLTKHVSSVDSYLTQQLAAVGVSLAKYDPASDVVQGVDFRFELRTTPSPRQLALAVAQVDRVIRVAAGLAAYMHPELGIWTGGRLQDLRALEAWLQTNSEAWDLEIEYLGLGSFKLNLKPSGKTIKKVVKHSEAVITILVGLATITGYTVKTFVPDTPSTPAASQSVVQAKGKSIHLPPPRKNQIIYHLSPGSTISGSTTLPDGTRIEWKSKVGKKGATFTDDTPQ
jgi:Lsr2